MGQKSNSLSKNEKQYISSKNVNEPESVPKLIPKIQLLKNDTVIPPKLKNGKSKQYNGFYSNIV